jgi:hypothetical protein
MLVEAGAGTAGDVRKIRSGGELGLFVRSIVGLDKQAAAARRLLPLTRRVRATLEARWHAHRCPAEGWVFAAPTQSGHIEGFSLLKQHRRALLLSGFARSFSTLFGTRSSRGWGHWAMTPRR